MNKERIFKTLENGLQIYFYPDSKKHSVFIDLMVKYGAFHSDFKADGEQYHIHNGMAHLLEHFLFEKNKFGNFATLFGSRGMQTNAITSTYMTDFYVDAVEEVEFALEHLIKGVMTPVFTKEALEETKSPIYQEIRMRNDEIGRSVYKSQTRNMLVNYSYIDGLGTLKDVENFTLEEVKLCYDTFYQPKNEILFIAGNFDPEEMFLKVKDIYENLTFSDQEFSFIKKKEPKSVKKKYEVLTMPTFKEYINICYKLDFSKVSRESRRMLTYYIGFYFGETFSLISPFHKELVEKKIIEQPLSFNYDFFEDTLLLYVCGYTNDEKELVKRVRETLEGIPIFNEKLFGLDLKSEKMQKLCLDPSFYGLSRQFMENFNYFNTPRLDTVEDLQSLNFEDFKEFIKGLEFKEYFVTKVIDVK